jgi:quercetin dioxygenase-like cupin family protein
VCQLKTKGIMILQASDEGYVAVLPGIARKTLVYGEKTLMVQFRLEKGAILPIHAHPYEQTGYLVSGRMVLTIGGRSVEVGPGDSWCIAEGIEHGAEVGEDAVAVEVFAPVRPDYLPQAAQ